MSQLHHEFRDITRRLYEQISAPADERNWGSVRSLFHDRATMVRTGLSPDGQPFALVFSFDEYIDNAERLLEDKVFREAEITQELTEFGNVARLASVYEFELIERNQTANGRGVNFFNLFNDGDGWKIISIVWDNERPGVSLTDSGLFAQ